MKATEKKGLFGLPFSDKQISIFGSFLYQGLIALMLASVFNQNVKQLDDMGKAIEAQELVLKKKEQDRKIVRIKLRNRIQSTLSEKDAKKMAKKSAFSNLLANFKKKNIVKKNKVAKKVNPFESIGKNLKNMVNSRIGKSSNKEAIGAKALTQGQLQFDNMNVIDKSNKKVQSIDVQAINRILVANDLKFQKCYDKALLVDKSLNGKMKLSFLLGQIGKATKTSYRFKGVGGRSAKMNLRNCLDNVLRGVKFPTSARGKTILFNLLFKS